MKDKWIVLQDLCARLYTNTIVNYNDIEGCDYPLNIKTLSCFPEEKLKCYLRPMSSMTEEERMKIASMANFGNLTKSIQVIEACTPIIDYCYSRHLDIHCLIEKGLALEAPEGMYKMD